MSAPRRMMHTLHPILVLKNLFVRRDASKIPIGNYYCYDEKGTCPYWKSYQNRKDMDYLLLMGLLDVYT